MGLSDELDDALKALRVAIKNNQDNEAIKKQVDVIGKVLVSMEDQKTETKIEVAGFSHDISELIENRRLPVPLKSALRQKAPQSDPAVTIARSMVDVIEIVVAIG